MVRAATDPVVRWWQSAVEQVNWLSRWEHPEAVLPASGRTAGSPDPLADCGRPVRAAARLVFAGGPGGAAVLELAKLDPGAGPLLTVGVSEQVTGSRVAGRVRTAGCGVPA